MNVKNRILRRDIESTIGKYIVNNNKAWAIVGELQDKSLRIQPSSQEGHYLSCYVNNKEIKTLDFFIKYCNRDNVKWYAVDVYNNPNKHVYPVQDDIEDLIGDVNLELSNYESVKLPVDKGGQLWFDYRHLDMYYMFDHKLDFSIERYATNSISVKLNDEEFFTFKHSKRHREENRFILPSFELVEFVKNYLNDMGKLNPKYKVNTSNIYPKNILTNAKYNDGNIVEETLVIEGKDKRPSVSFTIYTNVKTRNYIILFTVPVSKDYYFRKVFIPNREITDFLETSKLRKDKDESKYKNKLKNLDGITLFNYEKTNNNVKIYTSKKNYRLELFYDDMYGLSNVKFTKDGKDCWSDDEINILNSKKELYKEIKTTTTLGQNVSKYRLGRPMFYNNRGYSVFEGISTFDYLDASGSRKVKRYVLVVERNKQYIIIVTDTPFLELNDKSWISVWGYKIK